MPSFIRNTSGGTAVGGGALAPRSRRGNTNQADGYWRGGAGVTYNTATGGATTTDYTESGIQYRSHTFTASSNFVLTALGDEPACQIMVQGGGGGGGGTPIGRGFGDGGGAAGGFATSTMFLPTGTYQVTVGGAGSGGSCTTGGTGGTSSFGAASASLITANGGTGGAGCEFCTGGGGSGGSASVTGTLGTSNVATTGANGQAGNGNCPAGSSGIANTYFDGTTQYYGTTKNASAQGCGCSATGTNYGGGGGGGHANCGCGAAGAQGVVIVRYKFVP